MAEAGAQERTEAPTVKRREDARKEGRVAISREVSSAALLGAFALYFLVAGQSNLLTIEGVWQDTFQHISSEELTVAHVQRILFNTLLATAPFVLAVFGLAFMVGALASVLQVGIMFTPLKLHPDRLNPISGLRRIFSSQGVADLLKSLFKMTVIGVVTYTTYRQDLLPILTLSQVPVLGIFAFNFALLGKLFGKVALALVVLAIFDYLYQRWHNEQQLRMTRQELKDELKQTEGDPQLRARVRQIQREMSRARMMENVPKADVVVTNPTHYAVALLYDREVMDAPRLVAKGADFVAQRIREVADENDVPIVENPLAARELFQHVEIGQEIPERFFRVVAEILAYVYRLKGNTAATAAPS
ncbi:MAG: flagellar biosynthesis protein FlhB [Candidatus Lambdaproteobacteria bacterium]|nr:flagellar biosynthesis protein FlhB [Candidatus Lambdaproteobacteria bacterium]